MAKRKQSAIGNGDVVEISSTTTQLNSQSIRHALERDTDMIANDTIDLFMESLRFSQSVAPLIIDDDGYAEGSIVSVVLENFMSYGYCEIRPGPQLNIVIGPNGTGKSSIVCALALGLGSTPSLLGRAKNISDFVKDGEDRSSIQIELKNVKGRNIVIKRFINKGSNASVWKLDGRTTSYQEIKSVVKSLRIQVDNLCQFLPQERVAEFAQLTTPLLLKRTLEAVGDEVSKNQMDKLITMQPKQYQLDKSIASDMAFLKTLQDRAEVVSKDVVKINERQQLTNEITLLEATIPLAKFCDAKNELAAAKDNAEKTLDEKTDLEYEIAPLELALQKCKDDSEQDMQNRTKLVEIADQNQSKLKTTVFSIMNLAQETKQKSNSIQGIKKRMKSQQDDAKKAEKKISDLEDIVRVEPPTEDLELEESIKSVTGDINEVYLLVSAMADSAKERARQKQELEKKTNNKKAELTQLKDITQMRLNILQQQHTDTFKGYMWYQKNSSRFRGKIYGPIQLVLGLKDKKYMDYVETALGGKSGSHLQTFVCEYAEDYKMFMNELVDHQQLRLTASWPGDIDIKKAIKTPCTEEKLKDHFGLEHFVVNLLDGPPLVLAYLCQQIHINCIPVGLKQVRIETIIDQSYFQQFIVAGSNYRVQKYTYGQGGTQTTVRPISRASLLTDEVKSDLYAQKCEELKLLEMEVGTIDAEMQALITKKQEQTQILNELKHKRENQKALKQDIQNRHNQWESENRRLARYRQDLESILKRPAKLEQEMESLKLQIIGQTKERGVLVCRYIEQLSEYVKRVVQRNKVSLKGLSSLAVYQQLKMFAKSQQSKVNEAVKKYEQARQEAISCQATLQVCHQDAEQAGKDLPDGLKNEFKKICASATSGDWNKSQEEIEDNINGLQARKNAITTANPTAFDTYEKLVVEVRNLDQKVRRDKHESVILTKEIAALTEQWEARLTLVVSQIDKNFAIGMDQIGCAGQVVIGRADSFQNWGIEIKVKFRDNEKLQQLTEHRQSGGERAVSIIVYLMALQKLACTPFRVVDEINQGMDPRNERMIHEHIVKGSNESGTSQYFVITPKVLADLYYDERVHILCINNGEWQPTKLETVPHYLQHYRQTRRST